MKESGASQGQSASDLIPTSLASTGSPPAASGDSLGGGTPLKPIPVFIATWALAGLGAVIGSALGSGAGKPGLFGGALVGGVLGVVAAVLVLTKLQWLLAEDRRGALVGGIAEFAIAAPVAVAHLHTPIIPVLICGLSGVGLLLGVGVARGWRRSS